MPGLNRQSAPWRFYVRLLTPPLLTLALVSFMAVNAVHMLAGLRAYVGGESLWSKARAEAVGQLLLYAQTQDPAHLAGHRDALTIIQSDRLAREGLTNHTLTIDQIAAHLIVGGNHPDDVMAMIDLYRHLGERGEFRNVLSAWLEGEQRIDELQAQAQLLQRAIERHADRAEINVLVQRVLNINEQIKPLELRFNHDLARASRLTEVILMGSVLISAIVLSLISMWLTRRTLAERTRHEGALAAINKRWELAASSADLGLYDLDPISGEMHLDAKAASLHGVGHADVIKRREEMAPLLFPQDLLSMRQAIERAQQSGEVLKMHYRIRLPDERIRTLLATGRLMGGHGGTPPRLLGVVRDVTDELALAEIALKHDAAERIAQAQRAFLSRLSHELRTPLNAVIGFAQLMLGDTRYPLSAVHARQAGLILSAGEHLLALVEDVFDLSKVESGDVSMNPQDIDVIQSLRIGAAMIDGVRAARNITVVDMLGNATLKAWADPQRLQQVIMNLLTNACKFNRQGGQVILEARSTATHVFVDIRDTGPGMSDEECQQLFQPFKRLESGQGIEGTGLGLYIVRQLLAHMQGSVSVSSEVGRGSCFSVQLPKAATQAQAA
jgi:signal transduction histidine kinase